MTAIRMVGSVGEVPLCRKSARQGEGGGDTGTLRSVVAHQGIEETEWRRRMQISTQEKVVLLDSMANSYMLRLHAELRTSDA